MKRIKYLTFAVASILLFVFANTQTILEDHVKLTQNHKEINKINDDLNSGRIKDVKAYTEQVGKHIEGAKMHHTEIEKKQTSQNKELSKEHHTEIKKHHAAAMKYHEEMKAEAAKVNPNIAKIKEHSTNINNEMYEAEQEHIEIKKKTKVTVRL